MRLFNQGKQISPLLALVPTKAKQVIAAGLGFSAIGVVSTFRFATNQIANLLAWVASDDVEKNWTLNLIALALTLCMTYLLLSRLLKQEAPVLPATQVPNPLATVMPTRQQITSNNASENYLAELQKPLPDTTDSRKIKPEEKLLADKLVAEQAAAAAKNEKDANELIAEQNAETLAEQQNTATPKI